MGYIDSLAICCWYLGNWCSN